MENNETQQLPRRLSVATAVATVVGVIIGSGIFRVPAEVATLAGTSGGMLLVWVAGAALTLCLALSLAELAAMFPQTGGIYVYVREAFGNLAAFVLGWTFLLINPAAWAAIATVFAEYLGQFVAMSDGQRRVVTVALIVAVTVANYRSVRLGAGVMNFFSFAKAVALVSLVLFIVGLGNAELGAFSEPLRWSPLTATGFLLALVSVLWAYDGVTPVCAVAGEIRDPQRNMPRALLTGVAIVATIYLAINVAYLWVLPLEVVQRSPMVASDAVGQVLGGGGSALIAGLVMVSTFGALAALAVSDPRVFFAMGRDGNFFRATSRVHPRFQTPHVAVAVAGLVACIYASIRTFEQLAATFVLGLVPFYALAVAAVWRLRAKRPELPRPYRTFGYPWVPLFYIAGIAVLMANALLETPGIALLNVGISLAGIPVYFIWKRRRGTG